MNLFFSFLIFLAGSSYATLWQVGPTRTYTMPSQVSGLVQNNDTVEVDPGVYFQDVCGWYANNLVLRGVNAFAHLQANFTGYQGKAIWVLGGNNIKVEWIEFSQCAVPSQNGAGIRQEGSNLTVLNCYFHDNENGILAGTVANSKITIRNTEFARNGFGDGLTHNLYINNIDTLVFEYNYSHHAIVGHELKSRAKVNIIRYNRIGNESTGNASREMDLPNGGRAIIVGNLVHQGTNSQNSNMFGYGLEGLSNPGPHDVYMINNTFVNERPTCSFLQFQTGTGFYKGYNNIFTGTGNYVNGSFPATIDTAGNWRVTSINAVMLVSYPTYDYHLTALSPARDLGSNPGSIGNFSLVATEEYVHPVSSLTRCVSTATDAGAHEYCVLGDESPSGVGSFSYPNPATDLIHFSERQDEIRFFTIQGQESGKYSDISSIDITTLEDGIYLVVCRLGSKMTSFKVVIFRKN